MIHWDNEHSEPAEEHAAQTVPEDAAPDSLHSSAPPNQPADAGVSPLSDVTPGEELSGPIPSIGYVTGEQLIEAAKRSNKTYHIELIQKALEFARRAHEGQTRRSGEPYVCHPISVAIILIELGMDTESVAAALLHDVVEDTEVDLPTLRREFGDDIATLVDGVTKLTKMPTFSREEQQGENLRKMLLAMSEDIRVIIIKLADRLHNMRTIEAQPPDKRREKSLETLEVYAPIAHRLGIRAVKEELEDLGIRQLDPVGYSEIIAALASREQDRTALLDDIRRQISERLSDVAPGAYLEGRVKSIHGIYRKMYMQGHAFDEIYDIYAVRIIVDTVTECYNILGIIHDMFRSIPGRFKDYISTPKPNRYQSLHTTVITRAGVPFEVQIRTWEMHHTAEYGIAAHWKYKEGVANKDNRSDERLAWIRQLLESQKESDDVEEIVRTIKSDLAPEEVFVVSPKGDVISLPVGSTVIDFAYAIHSAVGNRMIGAKVDGRIVPIDYQVKTGEIVEILTTSQQGHGPSRDWLKIVKTSEARSKIRSWFKKEKRAENIVEGKAEFDREMRRDMMELTEEQRSDFLMGFAKQYHCQTIDDFFAMIGYGGLSLQRILPRIKEEYHKLYRSAQPAEVDLQQLVDQRKPARASEGVVIEGIDNCLVRLSHCCDPLPGDSIIGFITRGHGVSVHKRDCPNVPRDIAKAEQPERWVNAFWARSQSESFKSTLQVVANDRPNVIADVTITLANMRVPIYAVNARQLKDGTSQMILTIGSENLIHLGNIMERLRKVGNVLTVERM